MDLKSHDPIFNQPSSLYDNRVVEPPIKSYGNFKANPRPTKKKKSKKFFYGLIIIVILLIVVIFSLFMTKSNKANKPVNHKKTKSNSLVIKTNNYNSSTSNLSFNYPTNWTVNDNGNGLIKIISPIVKLTSDNLTTLNGKINITINQQAVLPTAFGSYSAAVDSSQLISYNAPTTVQRGQTYLTFVQYPTTTVLGGLDGIYVTGAFGYQKLQEIPATDILKLSPLIIVSFDSCSNSSCSIVAPLTISNKMLQTSLIDQTTYNIIKSLQIN